MAVALGGALRHKAFLVLTDERGGNNGKSKVLKLMELTFGKLGASTQSGFLYASSYEGGANAHAANELSYMGKRLAQFDETDKVKSLDISKIKRLTGGAPTVGMRGAGADTVTEFRWTAFILIACNEGKFPPIDSSDEAFMARLVPIPMRAKFNDLLAAAGERWAYPVDMDMDDKLTNVRCANIHVLLNALLRYNADGRALPLPPGCVQLRAKMMRAGPRVQALHEFVGARVQFTLERTGTLAGRKVLGFVRRAELKHAFEMSLDTHATAVFRGIADKDMKKLMDSVMESYGRPLVMDTYVNGVREKLVYNNCKLVPHMEDMDME
jgi:hypothetical protein